MAALARHRSWHPEAPIPRQKRKLQPAVGWLISPMFKRFGMLCSHRDSAKGPLSRSSQPHARDLVSVCQPDVTGRLSLVQVERQRRGALQERMARQLRRRRQVEQLQRAQTTRRPCAARCSGAGCSSWGARCRERRCCWSSGAPMNNPPCMHRSAPAWTAKSPAA